MSFGVFEIGEYFESCIQDEFGYSLHIALPQDCDACVIIDLMMSLYSSPVYKKAQAS